MIYCEDIIFKKMSEFYSFYGDKIHFVRFLNGEKYLKYEFFLNFMSYDRESYIQMIYFFKKKIKFLQ